MSSTIDDYLKAARYYLGTKALGDKKEAIILLEAIKEQSKEARNLLTTVSDKQDEVAPSSYPNWHKKDSTNTDIPPNLGPKHKP